MTYYLRLMAIKNSDDVSYATLYFKAKNKKNVFFKFLFNKSYYGTVDITQYVYTTKKEGGNYIILMCKRTPGRKLWLKFIDNVFRIDGSEIFSEMI